MRRAYKINGFLALVCMLAGCAAVNENENMASDANTVSPVTVSDSLVTDTAAVLNDTVAHHR